MAQLLITKGPQDGMVYEITKDVTYIGRDPSCDIFFPDRKMSRLHCTISLGNDGEYTLRDLESRNGTYVNGVLIKSVNLKNNDSTEIGDTELLFETAPQDNDSSIGKISDFVTNSEWGKTKTVLKTDEESYIKMPAKVTVGDLRHAYRRLLKLSQISEKLHLIKDRETLFHKSCDVIFEQFAPDYVYLFTNENKDINLVAKKEKKDVKLKNRQISKSILHDCLEQKVGILISDVKQDKRYANSSSVILSAVRSALCIPIIENKEVIGIIYLDTLSPLMSFGKLDLQLLTGIAIQIAMCLNNIAMHKIALKKSAYQSELMIARKIQQKFLPKQPPALDGYAAAMFSQPTKIVGGDYFDFIKRKNGKTCLIIGDVSGKGLPSALMMASLRAHVISEAQHSATPEKLVENLNKYVWADMRGSMYVTFFLSELEPETGKLEFVNAGHCYPMLIKPDGSFTELKTGGFYLGLQDESTYEKGETIIEKGDVLLMITDGITDQLNEQKGIFGNKRLLKLIRKYRDKDPEDLISEIVTKIFHFMDGEELFDDMTIIALSRK